MQNVRKRDCIKLKKWETKLYKNSQKIRNTISQNFPLCLIRVIGDSKNNLHSIHSPRGKQQMFCTRSAKIVIVSRVFIISLSMNSLFDTFWVNEANFLKLSFFIGGYRVGALQEPIPGSAPPSVHLVGR